MTYNDALSYIYSFMGKKNIHKDNNSHISNVESILSILGYKQTFRVIHITGTKGKGSTTLCLSKMIESTGSKVATFTSPHIKSERERFRINGECISEYDFVCIVKKVKNVLDNDNYNITVFEIFTIIGLYYFYIQNVDYACIEVGIGGLYDCTNIVKSDISIITSISYDHTDILGDSLESIAIQKCGIIKPYSKVVSSSNIEVIEIIKREAIDKKSGIYILYRDFNFSVLENSNQRLTFEYMENQNKYLFNTTLLGMHQAENISLAFKAFTLLFENSSIYRVAIDSIRDFTIDARLTFFKNDNVDIIVDGAHNSKSLEVVLNNVLSWYDDIILLFAPIIGKDLDGMIGVLKNYDFEIIVSATTYKESDSENTMKYFENYKNITHISDFKIAMSYANNIAKEKNKALLVIGSLYSASEYINLYS